MARLPRLCQDERPLSPPFGGALLYNQATGARFFDARGSGAGAAVQFATLTTLPSLGAADFLVIDMGGHGGGAPQVPPPVPRRLQSVPFLPQSLGTKPAET